MLLFGGQRYNKKVKYGKDSLACWLSRPMLHAFEPCVIKFSGLDEMRYICQEKYYCMYNWIQLLV